jgi:hypothetical protein
MATLHLIKLCVGCDSVDDLTGWIRRRAKERKGRGQKLEHVHVTRMVPTRRDELLDGGSLYWVIRGQISSRGRSAHSRAGAIWRKRTRHVTSIVRRRVLRRCRSRCVGNCANWASFEGVLRRRRYR